MLENIDDTRFEIKFVANECDEYRIQSWILSSPLLFSKAYPERWINNVYFDTFNLDAFAENLSGISDRTKIRYRWYGNHIHPTAGTLEFKRKRNSCGWKHRFNIAQAPYHPGAHWDEIIADIKKNLPPNVLAQFEKNCHPIIINRYLRKYYESHDGKIRATIDTNQQVWDQRLSKKPNFTRPSLSLPKTLVLELKFSRNERERMTNLINLCPLRLSRNSKYVNAIRSIYPY